MPNSAVPAVTPSPPPRRLLILGCSKAKTTHDGLIPAIDRYDGPAFRVLRRYLRQRSDPALEVHVLSAGFGLIPGDRPIPFYDRPMTAPRATALQSCIGRELARIGLRPGTEPMTPATLLVVAGNAYLSALTSAAPRGGFPERCVAQGGQGKKLAALHDWLYSVSPEISCPRRDTGRPIRFRGVDVTLDRDGVLKLETGGLPAQATALTAWAVAIDGHRVAPKWLVSRATGLPVNRFTTSDALALLARLGIEAERV